MIVNILVLLTRFNDPKLLSKPKYMYPLLFKGIPVY